MARSPWLENFRQGSFRGAEFQIESHDMKGGRRSATHEFPQKDIGNSEDLGLVLKEFDLELFVVGDDYFEQRDALILALDKEGPGELIHPYLGTLKVQAGEYKLSETIKEGRIAKFSVHFSLAGEDRFPQAAEDDANNAATNAASARSKSASAFEQAFSVANQPAFVVQSAADSVGKAVDFLDKSVKKVTAPVANLSFAISNLKAQINTLIRTPGKLAAQVQATFDTLFDEFENEPETTEKIMGQFSNLDAEYEPVLLGTPSRQQESDNQASVIGFFNQEALANQARAAVEIDFTSVQSALASRDAVIGGFDLQLENVLDDDLFQAIKDLQTSLARAIPRAGITEIIQFTPEMTMPAFLISYRLFKTLAKENEIVEQNNIEHPGFVSGGSPIEVSAGV